MTASLRCRRGGQGCQPAPQTVGRVAQVEQVEQAARVVVGVGVGVPQLVGDAVQEQAPALGVHVHGEVLEDVHVAAVGNAAHAGAVSLGPDELDGLGANIPEK